MTIKNKIIWNLINALLAGGLVLVGSFSSGNITMQSFIVAMMASLAVAITQFKEFWNKERKEFVSMPIFKFL